MREPKDVDLTNVRREIQEFVSNVLSRIDTRVQYHEEAEFVILLRKERKRREDWFNDFIAPAKRAKEAAERALREQEIIRDEALQPLIDAERNITKALLEFDQAEIDRVNKEKKPVLELQEKENLRYQRQIARAEQRGDDPSDVRPLTLYETPEAPQKTTKCAVGQFTTKVIKKLHIFDESQIPDAFLLKSPNKVLIDRTLRAGIAVPGCLLKEELSSAVRLA